MTETEHPSIRLLTAADAPIAAALSAHVGWNHTPQTWAQTISWPGVSAYGLFVESGLAGSTVTLEYSPALAWIGNVITHPAHQKRGYARRLMEHALNRLNIHGVRSIMLDASGQGYPLYVSMGFQTLYPIQSWVRKAAGSSAPASSAIRLMTQDDCAAVTAADAALIGVERPQVITSYWTPGFSWVWEDAGLITGYLLARQRGTGWFLGPSYHPDPQGAAALFQTAAAALTGQELRADVPAPNEAAIRIVQSLGFQQAERHITRMILSGQPPGQMERQYSVGSFTTG